DPSRAAFLGGPTKYDSQNITKGEPVDYETLILIFTAIIYEALPFIVLGVVLAGILEEFVPQQAIAKIIPRNRVLAIGLGGILGIVFPMCECGIIVVMKRLLRKGLPLSVCVSYVLAGPIINVVVLMSTYVAFNPSDPAFRIFGGPLNVVLLRAGLGYVVAFFTALIVHWQETRVGAFALLAPSVTKGLKVVLSDADDGDQGPRAWGQRINNITQPALNDFIDIVAFLVLGAFIAAAGRMLLEQSNLVGLLEQNIAIAILLMMAIAV